jgi:hypothetical protein
MSKNIQNDIKVVAQYLGGSNLYGLNTPTSDEDIRYVFVNTDVGQVLGLDRFEHLDKRTKDEDSFGMELRGFFSLLRKTNTQVMEVLYAPPSAFTVLDPKFKTLVLDEYTKFIDSDRFFKSLCGYIFTERRLALGERAGQIGGKRYEAVEKYGYSPKNMVQLYRLAYAGIEFFRSGIFPTNIKTYNEDIWKRLMSIKTEPWLYNPEQLVAETKVLEDVLITAHNNTKIQYIFDIEYANKVCAIFYKEFLVNYFNIYNI